jgi:hypothetical protein
LPFRKEAPLFCAPEAKPQPQALVVCGPESQRLSAQNAASRWLVSNTIHAMTRTFV